MSGYGYKRRDDAPPKLVPATGTRTSEMPSRVRASRSREARSHPGTLNPEIFGDLELIQETVVTPEAVTTPLVLAATVTALEGEFESLSALSANMGEVTAGVVRDADNQLRLDMDNKVITVKDGNGTTRGVFGKLGAGAEDWGLVVYSSLGSLILGANGLGTNVVGEDQVQTDAITNTKILNAAISRAKIADLAVNDAKIANLLVNKLLAGSMAVGQYIQSTDYSAGSAGWRIGRTAAEFNDVTIRGTLDGASGTFSGSLSAVSGTFDTITAGLLQYSATRFIDLSATGTDPFFRFDDVIFRADGTRSWPNEVVNPPALLDADCSGNWTGTGTAYDINWTVNGQVDPTTDYRIRVSFYRDRAMVDQVAGIAVATTMPYERTVAGGASGDDVYAVVSLTKPDGTTLSTLETRELPQTI